MPKLLLLFANLRRICGVLPSRLQRELWKLFVLMTLLGVVELASVMALTGFFTVLSSPERISNSRYARELVEHVPAAATLLADYRRLILWACVLPIGLLLLKNLSSAAVAWRSAMLGEKVAAHVGSGIMERYLSMPYSWHAVALGTYHSLTSVAYVKRNR